MATLQTNPQFMEPTEASKAHQTTPQIGLNQPKSSSNTAVVSSKRRRIMASAGRHFHSLARKDDRIDVNHSLDMRISSPFAFQKLGEASPASTVSNNQLELVPTNNETRDQPILRPQIKQDSSHCTSPLDKPLPSIPVAVVDTKSPKVRRSLIDAAEKPLRRSLSPHTSEIWPALSPEKSNSRKSHGNLIKQQQVSLGDSVIERIKNLNLNDDTVPSRTSSMVSEETAIDTNLTNKGPIESDHGQSGEVVVTHTADTYATEQTGSNYDHGSMEAQDQSTPIPVRSPFYGIGHGRLLDIRKRLSSTTLASLDKKKRKIDENQLPDNIVIDRPRQSRRTKPDHERRSDHSRSRSRHRVTEQGSPYVVSQEYKQEIQTSEPPQQKTLSSSNQLSPIFRDLTAIKSSHNLKHLGRSSIPLPSRLIQRPIAAEHKTGSTTPVSATERSPSDEETCDGDVDTDVDDRKPRKLSQASKPAVMAENDPPLQTVGPCRSMTSSAIIDGYMDGQDNGSKTSLSDGTAALTIHGEDDYESFRVRSLNRAAPKFGPKLRISDSAKGLLIGDGMEEKQVVEVNVSGERRDFGEPILPPRTNKPLQLIARTEDDNLMKPATASSHTAAPSAKPIPAAILAPPIKAAIPQDTSGHIGWPFKHSIITPYKQEELVSNEECGSDQPNPDQTDCGDGPKVVQNGLLLSNPVLSKNLQKTEKEDASHETVTISRDFALSTGNNLHEKGFPVRTSSRAAFRPEPGLQRDSLLSRELTSKQFASRQQSDKVQIATGLRSKSTKHTSKDTRKVSGTPASKVDAQISAEPVSTSKVLMSNLRGLFQKRSSSQQGGRHVKDLGSSPLTPGFPSPRFAKSQQPRKTKITPTILERRVARREPNPFERAHRDIATVTPRTSLLPKKEIRRKPVSIVGTEPFPELDVAPPEVEADAQSPDIATISNLIGDLLDQANASPHLRRKEELIGLSKSLIQIIHAARTAEQAKEEAKHAAIKAEMECLKIRRNIESVTALVTGAIYGDNGAGVRDTGRHE